MKILQVKKLPIYDLFQGQGWETWTRVVMNDKHLPKVIGGERLSAEEKEVVKHLISERTQNAGR